VTRILYVHHGRGIGGAPLSLLYLIRGLDRARFQPVVACLHESAAADLFRRDGIETVVLRGVSDFSHTNVLWYPWWQWPKTLLRLAQFPLSYFRALRFLRRHSFDIVHLNTSTLTAFGLAAHGTGARVAWHIREPLHPGYFGLRRWAIRRIIDRCADVVIPISRHDAAQLLPSGRIEVVYNFVDRAQFHPGIDGAAVRAEFGISSGRSLVLMLGGVNPVKGTREFAEAAARVLAAGADAQFVVAGPVPAPSLRARLSGLTSYARSVREAMPPSLRERMIFTGVRADVPQLLAAADILCFPSTVPHFARPVIEASAMGVPVVASDLGGPQELVRHGETGLLVPAHDAAALADALLTLLHDAALRERMGQAGIAFAREHFDADTNTCAVLGLYERLLASTSAPPVSA
jgi:glycosyltransferase involved in cell wall biosynthesis